MSSFTAPGNRYATDRIVVDLDDQAVVEFILDQLGVERSSHVDVIREFRLARISIVAVTDDQVDLLEDGAATRQEIVAYNAGEKLDIPVSAMDVLMGVIRKRARPWVLRMGKDRDMDHLEALPHSGGGKGLPLPAEARDFRLADGTRLQPRQTHATGDHVLVGVLDSALYPNTALQGRYELSDMLTSQPPRRAWTGHAAFVVGRILLRAPNAGITVRYVLDDNGTTTAWDVAVRMADLLRLGVKIINMSLGGWTLDNKAPFLMSTAVAEVLKKQVVVVAAAGNHGDGEVTVAQPDGRGGFTGVVLTSNPRAKTWPAALPGVIAVGAACVQGSGDGVTLQPTRFTPRNVDWIDAWAPGYGVTSTFLDGEVDAVIGKGAGPLTKIRIGSFEGYATWSGTSMATGDVTGEIARLAALDGDVAAAWAQIQQRKAITIAGAADVRPAAGLTDWSSAP